MRAGLRARALTTLATLASTALLVGCPVGPNYQRPEIAAPVEYRGAVDPAEAASLADLPWWQVFSDPVLQGLIDEAIRSNYDLRSAVARVEQAQALVGVARAPFFPQIGYQGLASRQRQFINPEFGNTTFNLFSGAFNLAWEIDVWGRIRRATEAAEAELLATDEFRRGVLLSLVSSVAQAYFELLELDSELAISRATVVSFTETLQLFERRYQGGVGSKLQTDRAAAALYETEATVPQLEAQIVAKENQINVLLGRNPGTVLRGSLLIDQVAPPTVPAGLPSELLHRRPDLRQAEDSIVSANAQIGVAVANFFPQIGLTSLYGGESLELKDVVKSSANIWNIVGSVAGPIFTGGQLIAQYRAQVAAWEEAKTQWAQSVISAFAEVSSALVLQEKLAEVRDAQEKTVHAYEGSVRLSLLRYNTGLANYYEVLEAQLLLFPAQLNLTRTQRDQLIVVVQLYRALGGGWELPTDRWTAGGGEVVPADQAVPTVQATPAPVATQR